MTWNRKLNILRKIRFLLFSTEKESNTFEVGNLQTSIRSSIHSKTEGPLIYHRKCLIQAQAYKIFCLFKSTSVVRNCHCHLDQTHSQFNCNSILICEWKISMSTTIYGPMLHANPQVQNMLSLLTILQYYSSFNLVKSHY